MLSASNSAGRLTKPFATIIPLQKPEMKTQKRSLQKDLRLILSTSDTDILKTHHRLYLLFSA